MKSKGQVAQKFKQAQFRHLKKELGRLLKRQAPNCKNNRVLALDIGPVGICSLDCQVCDVRFHDRAPDCEDWEPRHQKEEIKQSLKDFFQKKTVPEIAVRFPDVAALLWVLAEEKEDDPQAGPLLPTRDVLGVEVLVEEAGQMEEAVQRETRSLVDAAVGPVLFQVEDLTQQVRALTEERDALREMGNLAALSEAEIPWWKRWLPWH